MVITKLVKGLVLVCLLVSQINLSLAGEVTARRVWEKSATPGGFPTFFASAKEVSGAVIDNDLVTIKLLDSMARQAVDWGWLNPAVHDIPSYYQKLATRHNLLRDDGGLVETISRERFISTNWYVLKPDSSGSASTVTGGQPTEAVEVPVAEKVVKLTEQVRQLESLQGQYADYEKQLQLLWSGNNELKKRADDMVRVYQQVFKLSGYNTPEQLGIALSRLPALEQQLQQLNSVVTRLQEKVVQQDERIGQNENNITDLGSDLADTKKQVGANSDSLQQVQINLGQVQGGLAATNQKQDSHYYYIVCGAAALMFLLLLAWYHIRARRQDVVRITKLERAVNALPELKSGMEEKVDLEVIASNDAANKDGIPFNQQLGFICASNR